VPLSPVPARADLSRSGEAIERRRQFPTSEGAEEIPYPREMVLAGILAIVARSPADSVSIVARLGELGFTWAGSGPVAGHVHSLTTAYLLSSTPAMSRPSRRGTRLYELSPAGRLAMPAWMDYLRGLYSKLTMWLQEYARLTNPAARTTSLPR